MVRILVNKISEHPKECKFSHKINKMWYCKANFDNLCEILYDKKEWKIDNEIPIFKDNGRKYIEKLIFVREEE